MKKSELIDDLIAQGNDLKAINRILKRKRMKPISLADFENKKAEDDQVEVHVEEKLSKLNSKYENFTIGLKLHCKNNKKAIQLAQWSIKLDYIDPMIESFEQYSKLKFKIQYHSQLIAEKRYTNEQERQVLVSKLNEYRNIMDRFTKALFIQKDPVKARLLLKEML